jgi:hypothetical protein
MKIVALMDERLDVLSRMSAGRTKGCAIAHKLKRHRCRPTLAAKSGRHRHKTSPRCLVLASNQVSISQKPGNHTHEFNVRVKKIGGSGSSTSHLQEASRHAINLEPTEKSLASIRFFAMHRAVARHRSIFHACSRSFKNSCSRAIESGGPDCEPSPMPLLISIPQITPPAPR